MTIAPSNHGGLNHMDPDWAWAPWTESAEEKWDRARVAKLFRRAGFCASEDTLRQSVADGPDKSVDQLFSMESQSSFERESDGIAATVKATGDPKNLVTWWLHRIVSNPNSLLEKMTLFWHGHFATSAEKVLDVELMLEQNQLLRKHAIGDFRTMIHGISKDPAMLIYLDSVTNRKAHANENYARELMELFCLGEGNYSESDVQQLARCFTGWEIRRKQFRFNRYQHDTGMKELLGKTNVGSGEEAIDRVLDSPHLPYFIASKLFRFFVCDEPRPDRTLLKPLAERFASDQLQIQGMLRMLIRSQVFLSDWSDGRKIRSPIDLAVGFLTTLEATTNLERLANQLKEIGQALFFPPNVKGWDGGRAWINSSTLVGRANLVHQVVRDENTRFQSGSISAFAANQSWGSPEDLLLWMEQNFFAVAIRNENRQAIASKFMGKSGEEMMKEIISLLATFPEIHLS